MFELFPGLLASLRPKTLLARHGWWSNIFLTHPRPKILFVPAWLTLFRLNTFKLNILRLVFYKILSLPNLKFEKVVICFVDRKSRFKVWNSSFLRMCCLTHTYTTNIIYCCALIILMKLIKIHDNISFIC